MAVVLPSPPATASPGLDGVITKPDTTTRAPRVKPTKEDLLKTHAVHVQKQANSPENAPRPVKQPNLALAYPASTKSIREVDIIPLSQLEVNSHHRGSGLILKVISPPFLGAGAVSIVEDEFGNVDKISIYNQNDSSILSGVPEGCIIGVKEPYYTINGKNADGSEDYMICVDHPSDVTLIRFTDPIIPEPLRLGPLLKTAEDWKKAGDTAFLEKDFPTAVFCYTEALDCAEDEGFKPSIYTKRAGTSLILGRYDSAKEDALASRTGTTTDWKAYYTAGRACYGLCNYSESKEYLSKALELNPTNPAIKKEYERCLARLHEEETGDYDFEAIYKSLSPKNVHLDLGSFTRNTEVKASPLHGRGLFATKDLAPGDLVFAEKATLMPNQYEPMRASAALYALTVRQLLDNPSLCKSVLQLYPGEMTYERNPLEGTLVDGVPVLDVFVIEGLRNKNCFSVPLSTLEDTRPTAQEGRQAKGLWVHASNLNHACVPNTLRSFLGDMLISRATRHIKAGEEIFQQYVPVKSLPDVRNGVYKDGWGFECSCTLCVAELKQSSEASREKRKDLLAQVEKILNKKTPRAKTIIPDATIRSVDKLMKQLEEAHEPEIYGRLPRLTLIYGSNWLVGAYRGKKNYSKTIRYAVKVLRNFGFEMPQGAESQDKVWDPRQMFFSEEWHSLMTIHVVVALRRLAEAYNGLGKKEMAERSVEAAEFGYMLVTGFKNDLSNLDR
ncbi:uncharacterized protein PODANS_1_5000 [Podospora anserina S mat+]|uniref:Podospora anserina S mat+ genomic DNA chromosome 1, supercontig 1 n=1 Tax=Podospora anserina (strain S / ATCC MYA-4624 / DSM 980 / FGSC 10383) TaxID=515849 RepID=B2AAS3_PODAN|nr:uncharacterized protein PODANS_1_5000 [Podospora anserina S mat+]CAP60185.1 unnamed protein product [Podospora anserina S mat+]CDP22825.1 Putative protein of unknown function [Podospora anserina S mat+]